MTHKEEDAVLSWSLKKKEVYLSSYKVCCFLNGQSPKGNIMVNAPWVGVNLLFGKVLKSYSSEPQNPYNDTYFFSSFHPFLGSVFSAQR